MTQLTEHFSLEELTITQVRDVDNSLPARFLPAMKDTATRMEGVRGLLGSKPILVSSGYRCPLVNKVVGGSPASAHMRARAVDFIAPGVGTPYEICKVLASATATLEFDQLIYEESWVHISFDPRMRQEVLTKWTHGTYVSGLRGTQADQARERAIA